MAVWLRLLHCFELLGPFLVILVYTLPNISVINTVVESKDGSLSSM